MASTLEEFKPKLQELYEEVGKSGVIWIVGREMVRYCISEYFKGNRSMVQ
jgi:hypothetical protein